MDTQMLIGASFEAGTETDEKILNPKTGEIQGTLRLGGPAYVAPIAYDGALIVVTDRGEVVSIR